VILATKTSAWWKPTWYHACADEAVSLRLQVHDIHDTPWQDRVRDMKVTIDQADRPFPEAIQIVVLYRARQLKRQILPVLNFPGRAQLALGGFGYLRLLQDLQQLGATRACQRSASCSSIVPCASFPELVTENCVSFPSQLTV
jgi:hypothetical protein